MVKTINVHEAKTHLSRILDRVKAGETMILAKNGKPYAQLSPVEPPKPRELGFVKGELTDAFFEPMSEEELAEWYDGPVFPPEMDEPAS